MLDENLYGKCILPDSIILINQENISISNFYHLVVSNTLPKLNIGEGKWFSISSELKLKLNIKSYNSKEDRIKQEKIKAIYCQNINEKIKKIKLESGREISSSIVHRFLKLIDGKNNISKWENKLQVGDMIGIHQKETLIYDKILEIEITNYEGLVFDLEIENSKNYVANEILCHNTSQPCLQIPSSKKYFKFSKSKKPVKINLVVCASCRINFWKNLYSHEKNIILTHKNNNLKLTQTNAESIYLICNYSYWENNYHNSKIKEINFNVSQIDILEEELPQKKNNKFWDNLKNMNSQTIWIIYNYSEYLSSYHKSSQDSLNIHDFNSKILFNIKEVLQIESIKKNVFQTINQKFVNKIKLKKLNFTESESEKYQNYIYKFEDIYELSNLDFEQDVYLQKFCSYPQSKLTLNYFTLDNSSETTIYQNSQKIIKSLGNYGNRFIEQLTLASENSLECNICLHQIHNHNIGITNCGHVFCYSCLLKNSKFYPKCPRCRHPIQNENIFLFIQNWKMSQQNHKHIINECKDELQLGTKISNLIKLVLNLKKSKLIISNFDDNLVYIDRILQQFKIKSCIITNKNFQKINVKSNIGVYLINYQFKFYKLSPEIPVKNIIFNEPYYHTELKTWYHKLATLTAFYPKSNLYHIYINNTIEESQIENENMKIKI